ncbi:MAG: hypothetical protein QM766_02310 [Burkholderiaceae bacterium]
MIRPPSPASRFRPPSRQPAPWSRGPLARACRWLAGCAIAALAAAATPAAALEFGTPQVLSQSGQRLKIEVPYALARGERPSVTRFSVRSIRVEGGLSSLSPDDVTIAVPADGRYLILQSHDIVDAGRVAFELTVHDERSAPARFALGIPPGRAAASGDGLAAIAFPGTDRAAPPSRTVRPAAQRRRPARNTDGSA